MKYRESNTQHLPDVRGHSMFHEVPPMRRPGCSTVTCTRPLKSQEGCYKLNIIWVIKIKLPRFKLQRYKNIRESLIKFASLMKGSHFSMGSTFPPVPKNQAIVLCQT